MSRFTLDTAMCLLISYTGLSPSLACFPKTILLSFDNHLCSPQPRMQASGLACYHFARHYFGNRFFFLLLLPLRCFTSQRSLSYAIYSHMSDWAFPSRVSPFGHLRIFGCLHLPVAFRSLPRPSSAPST